jgi:hypothetical protein
MFEITRYASSHQERNVWSCPLESNQELRGYEPRTLPVKLEHDKLDMRVGFAPTNTWVAIRGITDSATA